MDNPIAALDQSFRSAAEAGQVDSIHRYGTFAVETKAGAYDDSVTEGVAHVTVTKGATRVGQTTPRPLYRGIIRRTKSGLPGPTDACQKSHA